MIIQLPFYIPPFTAEMPHSSPHSSDTSSSLTGNQAATNAITITNTHHIGQGSDLRLWAEQIRREGYYIFKVLCLVYNFDFFSYIFYENKNKVLETSRLHTLETKSKLEKVWYQSNIPLAIYIPNCNQNRLPLRYQKC